MFEDGYIAVFNTRKNNYRKPSIGDKSSPYFRYGLRTNNNKTKTVYLHRLVGLGFMIDTWNRDKVIDHIDCNPLNNLVNNLEWVTGEVNTQRATKNGLGVGRPRVFKVRKEKLSALYISQSSSKARNGLNYEEVDEIFKLIEKGILISKIAERLIVSQPCISQIIRGKRWRMHPSGKLYRSKLEAIS